MFRAYCNLSRSAGIRHDNQETIYVEVSICNKCCGCQGHSLLLQVLVAAEFLEVVFGTPSLVSWPIMMQEFRLRSVKLPLALLMLVVCVNAARRLPFCSQDWEVFKQPELHGPAVLHVSSFSDSSSGHLQTLRPMISGSALIRSWVRALCANSKFNIGGKCLEIDYLVSSHKDGNCTGLDLNLNPLSFPFADDTVLLCMHLVQGYGPAMGWWDPWATKAFARSALADILSLSMDACKCLHQEWRGDVEWWDLQETLYSKCWSGEPLRLCGCSRAQANCFVFKKKSMI